MPDKQELKPCDCGYMGEVKIKKSAFTEDRMYSVRCSKCFYSTNNFYSEAKAITAWNTRPTPDSKALQDAEIEVQCCEAHIDFMLEPEEMSRIGVNPADVEHVRPLQQKVLRILGAYNDFEAANKALQLKMAHARGLNKVLVNNAQKELDINKALREQVAELKEQEIDSCVMALARSMQFKLEKNKDKECNVMNPDGKGRGWEHCDPAWLLMRLRKEAGEVEDALSHRSWENIMLECADVANFAMMIHDIQVKLIEKHGGPETRREWNRG